MDTTISSNQARLIGATAALASIAAALLSLSRARARRKLPPGPPLYPFIGGIRSMPSEYQWLTFSEWAKKWGDVIYTSIFGLPVIVLNSADAARDLLDKRGSIYSDRPRAVVCNEMIGWDIIVFMSWGDRFRKHRRLMSQVLNSQAIVAYRDLQMNGVKLLLQDLLSTPREFDHHILRQSSMTIIRLTYGLNISSDDDAIVSVTGETIDRIVAEGAPGICPIDLFPFVKYYPSWLPGGGFQKRLKTLFGHVEDMKSAPFKRLQADRRAGLAKHSLIGKLLDEYETAGTLDSDQEYDVKIIGAAMYAAGTSTTMVTFFQLMAKHPEVVSKAQLEIDSIAKQERLLTLEDRASLPIVDCILKEVLRFHPAGPLGVPHAIMQDDEYRDMRIPRGSVIIPNVWQMLHDPRYFPDPDVFNPERFRGKVEKLEGNNVQVLNGLDKDDPSAIVFGFGRRICPGRYFVDTSLWLTISNVLALFDIGPPLDASGKPQVIGEIKFTSGVTSRPEPFECTIKPRNAKCSELIRDLEWDANI